MNHGTRLKRLREERGVTQQEMAERLGVKLPTYRTWEQGVTRLTLDNALRCGELLGCTPNDLCGVTADGSLVSDDEDALLAAFSRLDDADRGVLLRVAEALATN